MPENDDYAHLLGFPVVYVGEFMEISETIFRLERLIEKLRIESKKNSVCVWKYDDENQPMWEAACGLAWCMEGTPKENEMIYCPKCGKILVEMMPEREEDDDD